MRGADVVKRLVAAAVALWVLRWAAMMLAAYAGRYWLPVGPPPIESARRPGWMPGPNVGEPGFPHEPQLLSPSARSL